MKPLNCVQGKPLHLVLGDATQQVQVTLLEEKVLCHNATGTICLLGRQVLFGDVPGNGKLL